MFRKLFSVSFSVIVVFFLLFGAWYTNKVAGQELCIPSLSQMVDGQPISPDMMLSPLQSFPQLDTRSWLNSPVYTQESLKDKVIVVHFWSPSCVQSLRSIAVMKQLASTYAGNDFLFLSVLTPRDFFEGETETVKTFLREEGVSYPVVLDPDRAVWKAFDNRFWPGTYVFDQKGVLQMRTFGMNDYARVEETVRSLLPSYQHISQAEKIKKREANGTFFGYKRASTFGSPESPVKSVQSLYHFPSVFDVGTWALHGEWTLEKEQSYFTGNGEGRFGFRFDSAGLGISLSLDRRDQTFIPIFLDGKPVPVEFAGSDVAAGQEGSFVVVEFTKVYHLLKGLTGEHTVELRPTKPGLHVHASVTE